MRRTMLPKLATAAACLMLASCGLFSKEKLQLDGERISVLDTETKLRPDYAEGEYKLDNRYWVWEEYLDNQQWNGKVTVEKVNIITKHTKPSAANQNGGIIQKEAPIDASNVMYLHNGKATRIGFKVEDGKKVRVAKSTGEVIDK